MQLTLTRNRCRSHLPDGTLFHGYMVTMSGWKHTATFSAAKGPDVGGWKAFAVMCRETGTPVGHGDTRAEAIAEAQAGLDALGFSAFRRWLVQNRKAWKKPPKRRRATPETVEAVKAWLQRGQGAPPVPAVVLGRVLAQIAPGARRGRSWDISRALLLTQAKG